MTAATRIYLYRKSADTRAKIVNINHKNRDSEKTRANGLSASVQSDKDI